MAIFCIYKSNNEGIGCIDGSIKRREIEVSRRFIFLPIPIIIIYNIKIILRKNSNIMGNEF
jgi:hypothetical protein